MKFEIYQPKLDDEEYEDSVLRNLYLDCTMKPSQDSIRKANEIYFRVAEIDALSFDHVFEIGNIGPETAIRKIRPMRSISVGDLIRCRETGDMRYVDRYGFGHIDVEKWNSYHK